MTEKIACIIQARMGSKRLPKKVLKLLDEKYTVLDYVVNQINSSKFFNKIIIATTNLDEDDVIEDFADQHNLDIFRGSSEDVLDRYYQCAKKFSIDNIVRITADNPLIDPNIIDLVIDEYKNNKCDYASNTLDRTFPYGTEVEVFSFKSLENAWNNAKKPSEREHVTPFIYNPQNGFILINKENKEDLSYLRYTVDRIEDINLVREIIKNIPTRPVLIQDVIELYKKRSEIFAINKNVKHDGYTTSIKKDEKHFRSQKDQA